MQRVAIGRAMVRQPQAFLLDEPLSNLDASLQGQMRLELVRLHRELDATMIYVTHDQLEAMTMADRIVILNHGRVEQIGPPMELYRHPATLFVAGFIGAPKMNILDAEVKSSGQLLTLLLANGESVTVPAPSPRQPGPESQIRRPARARRSAAGRRITWRGGSAGTSGLASLSACAMARQNKVRRSNRRGHRGPLRRSRYASRACRRMSSVRCFGEDHAPRRCRRNSSTKENHA